MKAVTQRQVRKLIRYSFYPLLVLAAMGTFLALYKGFDNQQLPLLSAAISIAAIVIIHISERLFPYRPEWNLSQGDRVSNFIFTNLALPGLSKIAEIGLAWLFLDSASGFVREKIHPLWPAHWPLLVQLIVALVICEFFFYWTHRWGHRIEALWKFHSIHHAVKRVYWDNAGRFHPLDLFLNWVLYFAPLFIMGVPSTVIAAFLTLNAVTGLLEHANVDFDAGFLNRIFNTAQAHRWHHSMIIKESSSNFGKVLSIWDQVFGTFFWPKHLDVGEVGVEEAMPKDVAGQMLYPFKELHRMRKEKSVGRRITSQESDHSAKQHSDSEQ